MARRRENDPTLWSGPAMWMQRQRLAGMPGEAGPLRLSTWLRDIGSPNLRCTRQEIQMHVEELPSVKEVVSTLEAQGQRLSDADLVGASRSALTSARDAPPDRWTHRRRASRWPWVACAILGTTILGLVFLTPAFRRWKAARRASDRPDGVMGDAKQALS